LLSQIGNPIDPPAFAAAQVVMNDGGKLEKVHGIFNEVIDSELATIQDFCKQLTYGKISVW
jgi:S-adenosylmethionine synthetase